MRLRIKNVGIVNNANVDLNGLTVITGNNDSGKTTIGKIMYSLVSSVSNIAERALKNKISSAFNEMYDILEMLNINQVFEFRYDSAATSLEINYPNIWAVLKLNLNVVSSLRDLVKFVDEFEVELIHFDVKFVTDKSFMVKRFSSSAYRNMLQEAIEKLKYLKIIIRDDPDLIKYTNSEVLRYLNSEFNDQIAPIRYPKYESSIIFEDSNGVSYFYVLIRNGQIDQKPAFRLTPFRKCYFINDVNVVDDLYDFSNNFLNDINDNFYLSRNKHRNLYLYLNRGHLVTHKEQLLKGILNKKNTFEENINSKNFEKIMNIFKKTFYDSIILDKNKLVCKNNKLDIRNLATGSKLFLILKELFVNGELDSNTVVVLDEPENHLHPEWQNLLAELVVILMKEYGIRFIVTTHSPNLLLALDTMKLKYNLYDSFDFYYSNKLENGLVDMECVNENIEKAHYKINKPFIDMEELHNTLADGSDNDGEY